MLSSRVSKRAQWRAMGFGVIHLVAACGGDSATLPASMSPASAAEVNAGSRAADGIAGSPAAGSGGVAATPMTATPAQAGARTSGGAGAEATVGGAGAAAAATPEPAAPEMTAFDAGVPAAGAAADSGVPVVDAASAEPEPAPREDLGEGDGSDVITIGDSWMSLGATGIQQSLTRVSGQRYRTHGVAATRLLNGQIPGQYDSAKRANPDIKTVVMTGGGNDIIMVPGLRADCMAGGDQCAMVLTEILDKLTEMWTEMAADGVRDVVYVQYSNPEGNNVSFMLPSGDGVAKRCEEVPEPLRCHRVETLDIVMGDLPDGIHPSAAAYDRIGKVVHELMIEQGMRR